MNPSISASTSRLARLAAGILMLFLAVDAAKAQTEEEIKARFTHELHSWQQIDMRYRLFSPEGWSDDELYPLVLALHGGWGGSDNELQLEWRAATSWADTVNQNRHPAFVVAPRSPPNTALFQEPIQEVLVNLLDTLQARLPIDPDRVYVTGFSNGGIAAFRLLENNLDRFAAVVPMSGWGQPGMAYAYRHVPVWAFHGRNDDVISPRLTREIFRRMTELEMHPVYTHCDESGDCSPMDDCVLDGHLRYRRHLYTEFGDEGHAMWLRAYNDRRMIDWTYSQTRRTPEQEHVLFEVPLGVDMTFEPVDARRVGIAGDSGPLSGTKPFPLCDPDGDHIFSAEIAFEDSIRGRQLAYAFTHSAPDGSERVVESLAPQRTLLLDGSHPPVVFWNDANATVPSPPVLVRPTEGGHTLTTTTLEWLPGEISGRFDVQLASDSGFDRLLLSLSDLDVRSADVEVTHMMATYWWRARAVNVAGAGEWSAGSFMTVGTAPLLSEPADGSTVPANLVLRWHAYPGATSYSVQISESTDFSGATTKKRFNTEYAVPGLEEGKRYYWRVGAVGVPDYSEVWSFDVASSTDTDEGIPETCITALLGNFPNPVTGETTITFTLEQPTEVRILVADVLGRQVRTLRPEAGSAGPNSVTFDASDLPSGVYFYRIVAGDYTGTRTMTVVR